MLYVRPGAGPWLRAGRLCRAADGPRLSMNTRTLRSCSTTSTATLTVRRVVKVRLQGLDAIAIESSAARLHELEEELEPDVVLLLEPLRPARGAAAPRLRRALPRGWSVSRRRRSSTGRRPRSTRRGAPPWRQRRGAAGGEGGEGREERNRRRVVYVEAGRRASGREDEARGAQGGDRGRAPRVGSARPGRGRGVRSRRDPRARPRVVPSATERVGGRSRRRWFRLFRRPIDRRGLAREPSRSREGGRARTRPLRPCVPCPCWRRSRPSARRAVREAPRGSRSFRRRRGDRARVDRSTAPKQSLSSVREDFLHDRDGAPSSTSATSSALERRREGEPRSCVCTSRGDSERRVRCASCAPGVLPSRGCCARKKSSTRVLARGVGGAALRAVRGEVLHRRERMGGSQSDRPGDRSKAISPRRMRVESIASRAFEPGNRRTTRSIARPPPVEKTSGWQRHARTRTVALEHSVAPRDENKRQLPFTSLLVLSLGPPRTRRRPSDEPRAARESRLGAATILRPSVLSVRRRETRAGGGEGHFSPRFVTRGPPPASTPPPSPLPRGRPRVPRGHSAPALPPLSMVELESRPDAASPRARSARHPPPAHAYPTPSKDDAAPPAASSSPAREETAAKKARAGIEIALDRVGAIIPARHKGKPAGTPKPAEDARAAEEGAAGIRREARAPRGEKVLLSEVRRRPTS